MGRALLPKPRLALLFADPDGGGAGGFDGSARSFAPYAVRCPGCPGWPGVRMRRSASSLDGTASGGFQRRLAAGNRQRRNHRAHTEACHRRRPSGRDARRLQLPCHRFTSSERLLAIGASTKLQRPPFRVICSILFTFTDDFSAWRIGGVVPTMVEGMVAADVQCRSARAGVTLLLSG